MKYNVELKQNISDEHDDEKEHVLNQVSETQYHKTATKLIGIHRTHPYTVSFETES